MEKGAEMKKCNIRGFFFKPALNEKVKNIKSDLDVTDCQKAGVILKYAVIKIDMNVLMVVKLRKCVMLQWGLLK